MNTPCRILLVDDDENLRSVVKLALTGAGFEVYEAIEGKAALEFLKTQEVDLVLTDILMPGMEGAEFIYNLRSHRPGLRVVAMSGGGRLLPADCLNLARMLGATRTIAKPFSIEQLLEVIGEALRPDSVGGTALRKQAS